MSMRAVYRCTHSRRRQPVEQSYHISGKRRLASVSLLKASTTCRMSQPTKHVHSTSGEFEWSMPGEHGRVKVHGSTHRLNGCQPSSGRQPHSAIDDSGHSTPPSPPCPDKSQSSSPVRTTWRCHTHDIRRRRSFDPTFEAEIAFVPKFATDWASVRRGGCCTRLAHGVPHFEGPFVLHSTHAFCQTFSFFSRDVVLYHMILCPLFLRGSQGLRSLLGSIRLSIRLCTRAQTVDSCRACTACLFLYWYRP